MCDMAAARDTRHPANFWASVWRFALTLGLLLTWADRGLAQLPGLPGASAPASSPAPKSKTGETVATGTAPIKVERHVADSEVQATLQELLPKYPNVRHVEVSVDNGVVTLEGQVKDEDVIADVTEFTRRVEGVRLVLNRMKTDAEVLTARQLAQNVLNDIAKAVSRKWLVVLIGVGIFLLFVLLARLFNAYAETLLAPFVRNTMLRSLVGSIIGSVLILGGLLAALSILNLTRIVLSVLGLAGVFGLAVGFAFRDIAENFIASILLGVRRPFRIGDYLQVAGQAGVVSSLNTRATVLVTLEGNQVRIPNNIIYKEIIVNSSAAPSTRGNFDVIIPYEVSTAAALEAMTGALREQDGILPDPPARALVEALEPTGVRLRAYFWLPATGVDGYKLFSDAKLKVKVALQKAGITPPPMAVTMSVAGKVPVDVAEVNGHAHPDVALRPGAMVTREQAEANLANDCKLAERTAPPVPTDGRPTPEEHVMNQAGSRVADEGENLLANGREH